MDSPDPAFLTAILDQVPAEERSSVERVLPPLYEELRRIAGQLFAAQPPNHTLQPTAVVHEAYLKLADRVDVHWRDRQHFLALAAKVMRELLADYARRRNADKRGGDRARLTLVDDVVPSASAEIDLVAFHDALERLAALNPRHATIVEMRCLAGLGSQEVADALGVSRRTIELDWRAAQAWLQGELAGRDRA